MNSFEPYNQEAEEAFIGAFFLDGDLVKECTVKPDQIYSSKLRVIYGAIRRLDDKGKPIDLIAVVDELGTDQLVGIGGVSYITDLANSVPTTANFHFYEQLVKEYHQKRKAIQIAKKIIDQAGENEIGETLSTAIQDLMDIRGSKRTRIQVRFFLSSWICCWIARKTTAILLGFLQVFLIWTDSLEDFKNRFL